MPRNKWIAEIPSGVKFFLKRAIIIFVIWKLLYHLLLFGIRIPDRQLTIVTAKSAGIIYKYLGSKDFVFVKEEIKKGFPISVLYIDNRRAIGIADSCNGLELYILYIGFLFCIPEGFVRRSIYILAGLGGIFILNNFRCFGLAWLYVNNYSIADFAHHYLFKMVIYAAIFYTWVKYSKRHFSNVS